MSFKKKKKMENKICEIEFCLLKRALGLMLLLLIPIHFFFDTCSGRAHWHFQEICSGAAC